MVRHGRWTILAGLVVCLGPVGCAQVPVLPGAGHTPTEEMTQAPGKELPADAAARVCLATAQSLERGGKVHEATLLYERARQKDPRLHHVCRRLAVLYDRQGNFVRAQQEYEQALRLTPDDADLLNDLGYSHYSRGNWEEAEKYLRKSVDKNPKHERAWMNLGLALGQQERYADSVDAFTRVVGPARAQCNLAFILTTRGKQEEARGAYREALRLDPELKLAEAALAKLERAPMPETVSRTSKAERTAVGKRVPPEASEPIHVDPDQQVLESATQLAPVEGLLSSPGGQESANASRGERTAAAEPVVVGTWREAR
jgi:Flp pilus assembly protein TadD